MKNVKILYEDEFSIIIDKPAGLAVQGGKGVKSSLDKLLAEIRTPAPLLVHRLDKDTSGVLLAAKTKEAAAVFSRLLGSDRKAVKQYIAVCAGLPGKDGKLLDRGSINADLLIHGKMKESETKYRVLKSGSLPAENCGSYSVLELELGTGRMHQIRRHLAMTGSPILGDDKYGDFTLNKKLQKAMGLKRLLLHASRLIIKDEFNIDIRAPLPGYFDSFFTH